MLERLLGSGGESVLDAAAVLLRLRLEHPPRQRVFFNFNCVVLDVCEVPIGDYTLFGPAVQILHRMHPLDARTAAASASMASRCSIGADVWVGGGALILPGVRIGSRSVIGAGSVVTRDVPDDVFAAGNPCRVIRPIDPASSG